MEMINLDCLFCKIIKGEIPAKTIYEDDIVKVFLDIHPEVNGHMLIIPKKHFENLMDIEEDTLLHIQVTAKKMYDLLKEKMNVNGMTVLQNNDCAQLIKHYHLHVLPRIIDDGDLHLSKKPILKSPDDIYEILKN